MNNIMDLFFGSWKSSFEIYFKNQHWIWLEFINNYKYNKCDVANIRQRTVTNSDMVMAIISKTRGFKPASVSWISFMKCTLLGWSYIFNKYLALSSILNMKSLLHIYQVVIQTHESKSLHIYHWTDKCR